MNRYSSVLRYLPIILFALSACSTTRVLSPGERLFTGSDIQVKDKDFFKKNTIERELNNYLSPDPNHKFAGLFPLRLWFYNLAGDTAKDGKIRRLIRNRMGEEPVIFNRAQLDQNTNRLMQRLFNLGYFEAEIQTKIEEKGRKKIKTNYVIQANHIYTIDTIIFPDTINTLSRFLFQQKSESLLKSGNPYRIEKFKEERIRLSEYLRDQGYYYFSPEYLLFKVDSNKATKKLDVYLSLNKDIPDKAKIIYSINDVFIQIDEPQVNASDTLRFADRVYTGDIGSVKTELIHRSIFLDKGKGFSQQNYRATLEKLINLGVFSFTNIDFRPPNTKDTSLNAFISLQLATPKSLRLELLTTTKSNDLTGPSLHATYRDKNLFGGAEHVSLDFNTGIQFEMTQNEGGIRIFEYGTTMNYEVPRFIRPFSMANQWLGNRYTPNTNIKFGYNFVDRVDAFRLNALNASYGFNWQETSRKRHELQLVSVNYSKLSDLTNQFDSLLQNDYLIQQSYQQKFVFGLNYSYVFSNRNQINPIVKTYFHTNVEFAGNTLSLFQRLVNGNQPSADNPLDFLGINYSQFAVFRNDLRFTLPFYNESKLLTRFRTDIGYPYGNSRVLPYNRQFFIGGASSLRGFQSRTIGPGGKLPDSTLTRYLQHTGDIRLESNIEYRFNIIRFLKGAFFLDAGNIYNFSTSSDNNATHFEWSSFPEYIAVSGGAGIRFDASFFVLRFDLGLPLRKPYLSENNKWVLDEINFRNPVWRRNNLVLSIAIGYPF